MSEIQEAAENISRKRKYEVESDDSDDEKKAKRKLITQEPEPDLLDLADEVLMEILIKLDGESLHNLGL